MSIKAALKENSKMTVDYISQVNASIKNASPLELIQDPKLNPLPECLEPLKQNIASLNKKKQSVFHHQ